MKNNPFSCNTSNILRRVITMMRRRKYHLRLLHFRRVASSKSDLPQMAPMWPEKLASRLGCLGR